MDEITFVNRLRKDLNNPKLQVTNLPIPRDEQEYQQLLTTLRPIYLRTKKKFKRNHESRDDDE